jgi:hypothetical protein
MIVSTGAGSPVVDIEAQAGGFGSLSGGGWTMVDAASDTSPYSAREYIVEITPASFTLEPGESKEVEARIEIPETFEDAVRYAMIRFVTQHLGQSGGAGMRAAVDVPIILKRSDVQIAIEGRITGVMVGEIKSGEPIPVCITFQNTGNSHYRARNEVAVLNSQGDGLGRVVSALTPLGIIPSYSVEMDTSHNLSSPGEIVEPGTYQVESKVMLEDGTVLDTATVSFTIDEPYEAMAGIDETRICTFRFTDEIPGPFECESAGVVLSFEGTGPLTGEALIGRYREHPQTSIAFSAPSEQGGTGMTAIRFVDVHVSGVDRGTALIKMSYSDTELDEIGETSLLLALWNGEKWAQLSNLQVFTGANYITGEVPARALTGTVIGLGGGGPPDDDGGGFQWWIIAAIILGVIVISIPVFRRRRGEAQA